MFERRFRRLEEGVCFTGIQTTACIRDLNRDVSVSSLPVGTDGHLHVWTGMNDRIFEGHVYRHRQGRMSDDVVLFGNRYRNGCVRILGPEAVDALGDERLHQKLDDGRVMISLRNQDQVVFVDPGRGLQESWTLEAEIDTAPSTNGTIRITSPRERGTGGARRRFGEQSNRRVPAVERRVGRTWKDA